MAGLREQDKVLIRRSLAAWGSAHPEDAAGIAEALGRMDPPDPATLVDTLSARDQSLVWSLVSGVSGMDVVSVVEGKYPDDEIIATYDNGSFSSQASIQYDEEIVGRADDPNATLTTLCAVLADRYAHGG